MTPVDIFVVSGAVGLSLFIVAYAKLIANILCKLVEEN